jgi:hypothetical protein
MGMSLDQLARAHPEVEIGPLEWGGYLGYLELVDLPAGLLRGTHPDAFRTLVARVDGEKVAIDCI